MTHSLLLGTNEQVVKSSERRSDLDVNPKIHQEDFCSEMSRDAEETSDYTFPRTSSLSMQPNLEDMQRGFRDGEGL